MGAIVKQNSQSPTKMAEILCSIRSKLEDGYAMVSLLLCNHFICFTAAFIYYKCVRNRFVLETKPINVSIAPKMDK